MAKSIGILTAGGDSPGLNAAIRAIGKAAVRTHGMNVVGFLDGFRGLMQNRTIRLDSETLSGILTKGGTILGTSRDKPHKMELGGTVHDMTDVMLENFHKHHLDALVCLGGGGTQKNALRLVERGMPIVTLPKTIDNDVWGTDRTFGFDTALDIATEAVDRLHSTAHSHHRIIVVEIMGHNAGWLALGAGIAGGADVVLTPEIPYDIDHVAETVSARRKGGSRFSIVAVSEGALTKGDAARKAELRRIRQEADDKEERKQAKKELQELDAAQADSTVYLARRLEELTRLESRVTILGHIQRGGTPSPADRVLATQLGAAAARAVTEGNFGVMVAARGDEAVTLPISEVAGKRKTVPLDHPWFETARDLRIGLGN